MVRGQMRLLLEWADTLLLVGTLVVTTWLSQSASLRRHDVDSGARELPRPDAHRVIASFGVAEWVLVAVGTLFLLGMIFRTLDQSL